MRSGLALRVVPAPLPGAVGARVFLLREVEKKDPLSECLSGSFPKRFWGRATHFNTQGNELL